MKTLSWSVGIALLAAAVCVTSADAATIKCQRTIAKAGSQFVQARVKALSKCKEGIVKGSITGPCPDDKANASIAKAAGKLTDSIDKTCGGDDKVCGGNPTNEDTPLALEWPEFCPGFEHNSDAACTAAIKDCGDIAACIECVGKAAVDQAIALYYGNLALPSTANKALNGCQAAIGKATSAFLSSKTKALQKCWDAKLNGKLTELATCVPLGAGDGKYIGAIAKAETKKITTICKACGGADKGCDQTIFNVPGTGGTDDLLPAAIGFPATCPAVTIPGALTSCSQPIITLSDIVKCVDCVTEFKADCVDRLQVPQYTDYPAECSICLEPAPTGACPTSMEFNADGQSVDLDAGWTGLAHNNQVPTNGRITLSVSGCDLPNYPNCGECDVNGPLPNAGGVAFNNHRCKDQSWVQCSTDGDCITAGATGPCIFFFGSTLPLVAGGVAACVVNEISAAVTGTINIDSGESMTIVPLASQVFIGGGGDFDPCPQCNAGKCTNGPRINQSCSINGNSIQYGDVSLDCPPNPGSNVGTLKLNLNLGTNTQSVTLSTANPKCREHGAAGLRCFCDTCNEATKTACSTDLNCPSSGGGPGICGGKRCLGGSEVGKPCNTCIAGTNHGANCSNDSQCPGGGTCPLGCLGVCGDQATNAGDPCTNDSQCLGAIQACSAKCTRPGEETMPNVCLDDPDTPVVEGCQDIGHDQGQCPKGPTEANCSIQKQHSCTLDSDCAPGPSCPLCVAGQICIATNRVCFTGNGAIGSSINVTGKADTPCGGVAKPTVGSFFCLAPVGASSLNVASGTPGLGRVRIPGVVVIDP